MEKREINVIDYLFVLIKWRKLILINFLIVAIIAVIISLLLPKWYQAETIIMPPEKEGLSLGFGSSSDLAGFLMGGGGFELPMFATASDVFETILKSKGVLTNIIKKYNLQQLYHTKTLEETIRIMTSHTQIEVGKEGSIFIRFEAEGDPQLAAEVANEYVEELDKANKRIKISKASFTREFVEQRLAETKVDLKEAEETLRQFQEKHNTILLPQQTEAAINNAAELVAQQMALRIQLSALKRSLSKSHPEIMQLESKIDEIDRLILKMKYGEKSEKNSPQEVNQNLFVPLANTPELALEYARLMREVKIQEILFELLTQQYEQARINEARDTPTIQVLDKASPPTKKYRPKRAIIVIIASITSIFFSVFLIFSIEYLRGLKENRPEEYAKIDRIRTELKKDILFFSKK